MQLHTLLVNCRGVQLDVDVDGAANRINQNVRPKWWLLGQQNGNSEPGIFPWT
jgi:hypothetical protein